MIPHRVGDLAGIIPERFSKVNLRGWRGGNQAGRVPPNRAGKRSPGAVEREPDPGPGFRPTGARLFQSTVATVNFPAQLDSWILHL